MIHHNINCRIFEFTKNQKTIRKDLFKRYGTNINALLNADIETKPVEDIFSYDILKWLDDEKTNKRLSDYKFSSDSEKLIFEFTKDQMTIRKDIFKRYGTSINDISKIVTRISNLESQFRKVRYENDNYLRDIYKNIGENFVKYSLSN